VKALLSFAALLAGISVALGAYFAHALPADTSQAVRESLDTAVRYHLFHSIGILIVGQYAQSRSSPLFRYTIYLFIAGILLFSGGIYLKEGAGIPHFSRLIPFGGFSLILGWGNLAYALLRK
jgi:uncharacterized membrane protein YgdD (TMEM256/DUF423 family)